MLIGVMMDSLYIFLKNLRTKHNLNRKEFCRKLKITTSKLHFIEIKKDRFTFNLFQSVNEIFQLTEEEYKHFLLIYFRHNRKLELSFFDDKQENQIFNFLIDLMKGKI